ncbi:hypothetical protein [Actinomadura sp. 3N407]|uniref:hypothetical protein n=1 Tax=Actinomadura sp. 3N407 TaxID=3457423 RepID=UPI003FCEA40B
MPARHPRLIAVPGTLDGRAARLYVTAAVADPFAGRAELKDWAKAMAQADDLTECVLLGCDWPTDWDTHPDGRQTRLCRRGGCGWAQTCRNQNDPAPRLALAALITD